MVVPFFVFLKAVLRVGAQAMVPCNRLFKRNMGKLPGRLLGTITKEKEPYNTPQQKQPVYKNILIFSRKHNNICYMQFFC